MSKRAANRSQPAANQAAKASSSSTPAQLDQKRGSHLGEDLSALIRSTLTLKGSNMPLVFDTDGIVFSGTIATRDSEQDAWAYGVYVPTRALIHAHGPDDLRLLTIAFAVCRRRTDSRGVQKRRLRRAARAWQGEELMAHIPLPKGEETLGGCVALGDSVVVSPIIAAVFGH